MTDKNNYVEQLQKKLTAEKLRNEFMQIVNTITNKQIQENFKNEMVKKTWYYQKKFGFETNPRPGHEFWYVEADAFKHAFGSADMYFKYGNWGSIIGGIQHENKTPNNPQGEWNMDSWNNDQGRQVAKEIEKEYGKDFYNLPQQKRDDIIAVKVIMILRNGDLITNPADTRKYNGWLEKGTNWLNKQQNGKITGQAASIEDFNHIFTRDEISNMSSEEFTRNETSIIQQMQKGLIQNHPPQVNYSGYTNPISGNAQIYSREDIDAMSSDEYSQKEKAINAQLNSIGIPTNNELQTSSLSGGGTVYVRPYTRSDGTQVHGYYRSV